MNSKIAVFQKTINWRRLLLQAWIMGLPLTLVACGSSTAIKPDQEGTGVEAPAAEKAQEKTVWRYGPPPKGEKGEVKVLGAQRPEQAPEGSDLQAEDLSSAEESEQQASQETVIDYQPVVYFNYDQDTLSDEAVQIVRHYAKILLDNPMERVKLLGHTDERGSPEYNLALGERRAKAVKEVMVVFGVSQERVEVISYGEEKPAEDGHNEAAWAKNRRVEIVIY